MRLDQALVARGLIDSRSKASDLIKLGVVKVNQRLILKPAKIIKSILSRLQNRKLLL